MTVLSNGAPTLDSRRVLVDVFENRAEDPALDEMGRMVEIAPGSQYRKLAGTAALRADRPAEAVRHYERADPETGWLRDRKPYWGGWTTFWGRFAEAHHFQGNYKRELELVRRAKTLYPDDLRIRKRELRALAALGHLEELESAIADTEGLAGHTAQGPTGTAGGRVRVHRSVRGGHRPCWARFGDHGATRLSSGLSSLPGVRPAQRITSPPLSVHRLRALAKSSAGALPA